MDEWNIRILKEQGEWEKKKWISAPGLCDLVDHLFGQQETLVGLEIGVASGWTMNHFLQNLSNLKLIGIDPYIGYMDGSREITQEMLDAQHLAAQDNISDFAPRGKILRGYSQDFVNSFEIKLEDLESVGRLGYATGMSNIIVKELKMLDVYKRPIHCSDIKRETFYVKDNDVWEKETPENSKMKKAIKGISKKNMIKLNDWRDKHPDCLDSSSSYNDIYLNLMVESCGGRGDFTAGENKILKNIAKEVVIKK